MTPITVNVPESTDVSPPRVARIWALPARWLVKVALLLSPETTRSPLTTPPVLLTSDHQSTAAFSTKPFESVRAMAYTVTDEPAPALRGDDQSQPSACVSTWTLVATGAVMLNGMESTSVRPPALARKRYPVPTALTLRSPNEASPATAAWMGYRSEMADPA